MHKKPGAGKKTGARTAPNRAGRPGPSAGAGFRKNPHSINDLLQRRPALSYLTRAIPIQQSWAEWLRTVLPVELAPHLVSVVPGTGARGARELVVFADSAAWSTRLRYALVGIEAQIRARDATLGRISVRVLMKTAQSASAGASGS